VARHVRFSLAVAGIALVTLGSFVVPHDASLEPTGGGHLRAARASGDDPVALRSAANARNVAYRDLDLRFEVQASAVAASGIVVETSVLDSLRVQARRGALVLETAVQTGPTFRTTLLGTLVPGERYQVRLRVAGGRRLLAAVDGRPVLRYDLGPGSLAPRIDRVVVGSGFGDVRPFPGSVEDFRFSYQNLDGAPPRHRIRAHILQLIGGFLFVTAIVLTIFAIASNHSERDLLLARMRRPISWARRRAIPLGGTLVALGVITLVVVVPPANTQVHETGFRQIGPLRTEKGTSASFPLTRPEVRLFHRADALDVLITFQVRLDRFERASKFSPIVVSTTRGRSGMQIDVHPDRHLANNQTNFGPELPRHRWIDVDYEIRRDRTLFYAFDGKQVKWFTYDRPFLHPAPERLVIGGEPTVHTDFGGAVRDLRVRIVLLADDAWLDSAALNAFEAIACFAIALGAILLAWRLLSGVVAAGPVARGLAQTTFVTTGTVFALSVVVNLLAPQGRAGALPRNSWFFSNLARFSDFTEVTGQMRSLDPYLHQLGSYPPFGYWLVAPFSWWPEYAGLFTFLALCLGLMIWWFWSALTVGLETIARIGVVVVAVLSYPVLFAFDRGNVDIAVFLITAVAIGAYQRKRHGVSAALLGVAMAAKGVPGLFLLVFACRGQRRFLVAGLATAGVVSAIALLAFHGDPISNLSGFRDGLSASKTIWRDAPQSSTGYNTSLGGFLQAVGWAVNGEGAARDVRIALEPFTPLLTAVAVAVLGLYVVRRERALWRILTLAAVGMLLMFDVTYDYRLLFVFVPLAVFLQTARVQRSTLQIAVIFGLLLAPRTFFYIGTSAVGSGVLLGAPLLASLAALTVVDGERARRSDEQPRDIEVADA